MWWAFVADDHAAIQSGLAFSFALHQHGNATCQNVDLALLARDHIVQLIDDTREMGNLFFQMFHECSFYRRCVTAPSGLIEMFWLRQDG